MSTSLVDGKAGNAIDNGSRERAPPKYSITRGQDHALQWDPPIGSRELANALNYRYPMQNGLEEMMRHAILDFFDSEKVAVTETSEEAKTERDGPARSKAPDLATGPKKATEGAQTQQEESVQQPQTTQGPDMCIVWDVRTGESVKNKGRSGGFSRTRRQEIAKNRGNICEYHKKNKTRCDPTRCPDNKLYPGTSNKSNSIDKGNGDRKRDREDESPGDGSQALIESHATLRAHMNHSLRPINGMFSPVSPSSSKSTTQSVEGRTPPDQDYFSPTVQYPGTINPAKKLRLGVEDHTQVRDISKVDQVLNLTTVGLAFDWNDLQKDWPFNPEALAGDNVDWIEAIMTSDMPPLDFGWPLSFDAPTASPISTPFSNEFMEWTGQSFSDVRDLQGPSLGVALERVHDNFPAIGTEGIERKQQKSLRPTEDLSSLQPQSLDPACPKPQPKDIQSMKTENELYDAMHLGLSNYSVVEETALSKSNEITDLSQPEAVSAETHDSMLLGIPHFVMEAQARAPRGRASPSIIREHVSENVSSAPLSLPHTSYPEGVNMMLAKPHTHSQTTSAVDIRGSHRAPERFASCDLRFTFGLSAFSPPPPPPIDEAKVEEVAEEETDDLDVDMDEMNMMGEIEMMAEKVMAEEEMAPGMVARGSLTKEKVGREGLFKDEVVQVLHTEGGQTDGSMRAELGLTEDELSEEEHAEEEAEEEGEEQAYKDMMDQYGGTRSGPRLHSSPVLFAAQSFQSMRTRSAGRKPRDDIMCEPKSYRPKPADEVQNKSLIEMPHIEGPAHELSLLPIGTRAKISRVADEETKPDSTAQPDTSPNIGFLPDHTTSKVKSKKYALGSVGENSGLRDSSSPHQIYGGGANVPLHIPQIKDHSYTPISAIASTETYFQERIDSYMADNVIPIPFIDESGANAPEQRVGGVQDAPLRASGLELAPDDEFPTRPDVTSAVPKILLPDVQNEIYPAAKVIPVERKESKKESTPSGAYVEKAEIEIVRRRRQAGHRRSSKYMRPAKHEDVAELDKAIEHARAKGRNKLRVLFCLPVERMRELNLNPMRPVRGMVGLLKKMGGMKL